jgi:tRNA(Ile)-lysidine synthase
MASLGPFESNPTFAVAVSGGPDSMALAYLASRYAGGIGGDVKAFLVDHRLRPESTEEATRAAAALTAIGISAKILTIAKAPPSAGKPVWARTKRYELLEAAAAEIGVLHLLLGHHQDDQAETLLLNLARGSGSKGLAAMAPIRARQRVRLLRPLIGFDRTVIAATAQAAGLLVADDPSNRDPQYARTRVRAALGKGGESANLAATAGRLRSDDDAIEDATARLAAIASSISPLGLIRLNRVALINAPKSVAIRLLARAAHAAGGRRAAPRYTRVETVLAATRNGEYGKRTLGRSTITITPDQVTLWRELRPTPPSITADAGIWDGRFIFVCTPALSPAAEIRALGYAGLRQIEAFPEPPAWLYSAPRQALAALPAIWNGDSLVAAPEFGAFAGRNGGETDRLRLHATLRSWEPLAPC